MARGKLTFTNGGPNGLSARVEAMTDIAISVGADIVRESVAQGAELQAKALNEAVTPSGEARFARTKRGSAGRNDTTTMINAIGTSVDTKQNSVTGTWGWDAPEEYFEIQEHTAGSLFTSFIPTREAFYARVIKAVG